MTFVRPPLEPDPPDSSALEGRASLGLKALALLNGFGIALALFPAAVPAARLWTVSFNVASTLLVVLFLAEARGLDRWRPWAVAVVRPLLLVIAVAGAYQFIVTLLGGRMRIPFDVAIAIWALLGKPESESMPGLTPRSLFAVAGAAGLSAVMLFSQPLFDWGGVLDVRADALKTSMAVDCGAADPNGVVPSVVTITYDWSWTRSSPLPDGLDEIVLGWDGDDDQHRPLYLIGPTPDTTNGIHSGRFGYPSREMAEAVAAESRGTWHWGLELAERDHAPGHLVVTLERAQDAPANPQPLSIRASYVHLGVWRQDVAPLTCQW